MGKRERENPCEICSHFHKYEEGEICGICGHHLDITASFAAVHVSSFPTEILSGFIYLGTYDNASTFQLLRSQGITHILNAVPDSQVSYKNQFTYHVLGDQKSLFDSAIEFLEQCERDKVRVLVHCMSGKNRSPAVVIAYLMKAKGWRLAQSHRWVKDRRPSVELNPVFYQQLQEYERKLFGSNDNSKAVMPSLPSFNLPSFNFPVLSVFNNLGGSSISSQALSETPVQNFIFRAGDEAQERSTVDSTLSTTTSMSAVNDGSMDSS